MYKTDWPSKSTLPDSTFVSAEENEHAGFVRLKREMAEEHEEREGFTERTEDDQGNICGFTFPHNRSRVHAALE